MLHTYNKRRRVSIIIRDNELSQGMAVPAQVVQSPSVLAREAFELSSQLQMGTANQTVTVGQ